MEWLPQSHRGGDPNNAGLRLWLELAFLRRLMETGVWFLISRPWKDLRKVLYLCLKGVKGIMMLPNGARKRSEMNLPTCMYFPRPQMKSSLVDTVSSESHFP